MDAWHTLGGWSQASVLALLPVRLPLMSSPRVWGTPSRVSVFPVPPCVARG